ncbi:MAG TPA: quinone oxidoreductase [Polyangiales bacterium]|nr:quinone oxidoreductase [Polyangiales bacterium]
MSHAIFVDKPGDASVLSYREYDPGAPGAGQLRVKVEAAGVNFIDTYQRSGLYPRATPFVLGLEGAGRIEAVGADINGWKVGQRVAWSGQPGSYAEHIVLKPDQLIAVPDGVDTELAAAVLLQGMTAHSLATAVHNTQPGETVLVHAAAGGTGQLLVQELKRAGARVIGTCSSGKVELAQQAGCDHVIRYDREEIVAEVKRVNNGRGVDVVFDSVGKSTFDASLASLRPRGLLVLFGAASGPVPPFDPQRLNQGGSLYLTRPTLFHYTATRAELEHHANAVFDGIKTGALRARIAGRFPLSQAAKAHEELESRRSAGKLLLIPGS